MNGFTKRTIVVVLAWLALFSSSSLAAELTEHLSFLQPLIGTDWVGGYVGAEAPDLEITLRFEPILDGKAVRYIREAAAADFAGVTHFYWSPNRGEACFINLNNRGIVDEGVVASEGGNIVLRGHSHRSDGSVEFKITLSIDATNTLIDTFMRKKANEWVLGHVQEFIAKESLHEGEGP